MDLLKKELERKKRALQQALQQQSQPEPTAAVKEGAASHQPTTKKRRYVKTSELRRLQEEQERQRWEERQSRKQQQQQQQTDSALTMTTTKEKNGDDEKEQRQSQPPPASASATATAPAASTGAGEAINCMKESKNGTENDKPIQQPDKKTKETLTTTKADSSCSSSSSRPLAKLSSEEVTKRLRSLGLPVRLFGEQTIHKDNKNNSHNPTVVEEDADTARKLRLQAALATEQQARATLIEREDFRLEQGHSIRNRFLDRNDETKNQVNEGGMVAAHATNKASAPSKTNSGQQPKDEGADTTSKSFTSNEPSSISNTAAAKSTSGGVAALASTTDDHDPHRRIYLYFKGLLKSWEDDLIQRPDEVKRSVAGRNETKTHQQCKDYIRPLFKLCKTRQLEANLTTQLVKIVDECQRGEFVAAHDAYMDVAIGRAAWPIGVTMVGIHARTGRAKIESQNVAHVMNSELQRKYLTSVKRLMSYAQKQATHVDPSKKVLS